MRKRQHSFFITMESWGNVLFLVWRRQTVGDPVNSAKLLLPEQFQMVKH